MVLEKMFRGMFRKRLKGALRKTPRKILRKTLAKMTRKTFGKIVGRLCTCTIIAKPPGHMHLNNLKR